ncbi:MAG: YlxR family protein [Oscillospiraceae bacterium]|nr:YlxR family protein [Oscillospiraceae bacterium]
MEKKVPLRTCAGCGEMKSKTELIRVVKSPEGTVSLDLTGKAPGRGAYICRSAECLKKARKTRRFERGFKMKLPDDVYDRMEEALSERGNRGQAGTES